MKLEISYMHFLWTLFWFVKETGLDTDLWSKSVFCSERREPRRAAIGCTFSQIFYCQSCEKQYVRARQDPEGMLASTLRCPRRRAARKLRGWMRRAPKGMFMPFGLSACSTSLRREGGVHHRSSRRDLFRRNAAKHNARSGEGSIGC